MTRLARRAFGVAATASALLFIAVVFFWPFCQDLDGALDWHLTVFGRDYAVQGYVGQLFLTRYRLDPAPISAGSLGVANEVFIFGYSSNATFERVMCPFWFAAATASILPACWLLQRRRNLRAAQRASRRGLCPSCGYDLRATP